ncbi:MAG: hypothetical protein GY925_01155 [Actinomycetia bacterium]|nr:hypothetical protein [Actinomycetes bacterium]
MADEPCPEQTMDDRDDVATLDRVDESAVGDEIVEAGLSSASSRRFSDLLERIRGAPAESWVTFLVVLFSVGLVFVRLHPSRILSDTTPAGGDMGAHVWGPAYLRDNLLPGFSIRGWTMDWYGGFPAMHFYMVLPYLLIVLLDVILPYGTAFKLVAVAGVVTIPASTYFFGRMARLPFPVPALFSVAGLMFVFDFNFTIYGGNIASTLAGEFAFSLSLSFALLFLGFFIRGLDEGTHRGWAAVMLAATALSHLIPLAFAVGAAIVIVAARSYHRLPRLLGVGQTFLVSVAGVMMMAAVFRVTDSAVPRLVALASLVTLLLIADLRRTWWAVTAGIGGLLLSGFWMFPFLARRQYLNDMGWEKLYDVRNNLFQPELLSGTHLETTWLLGMAGLGVVLGVVLWDRMALTWIGIGASAGFAFVHWPDNRLWNARFLGFWYLALYVLAALGAWMLARAVGGELKQRWDASGHPYVGLAFQSARLAVPVLVFLFGYGYTSLHLGLLPGGGNTDDGGYAWGPLRVSADDRNFVSGWANWNFSGYEEKTAYPEYFNLMTTMDDIGKDPEHGCGRAMWEFGREHLDRYGTPMAPMLLPHWTDGCIASMEGLYFESTASVPHHFLLQSELSQDPSRPMRDIPYSDFDIDLGIAHMRTMGVSYYMAFSDTALAGAFTRPSDLVVIAQSDGWTIFKVVGTSVVEPLAYEPAVVEGIGQAGRDWTDPAVAWMNDELARQVVLVDDGPDDWARVGLTEPVEASEGVAAQPATAELAPLHLVDPVTVSNVEIEDDRVAFDVDQIGVPILVKVSYFPNWSVEGADAIYRSTPNHMVVVPTSTHVELSYGDTSVEYLGYLMTLAGIVMLWALARFEPPALIPRDDSSDPAFWERRTEIDELLDPVEAPHADDDRSVEVIAGAGVEADAELEGPDLDP